MKALNNFLLSALCTAICSCKESSVQQEDKNLVKERKIEALDTLLERQNTGHRKTVETDSFFLNIIYSSNYIKKLSDEVESSEGAIRYIKNETSPETLLVQVGVDHANFFSIQYTFACLRSDSTVFYQDFVSDRNVILYP